MSYRRESEGTYIEDAKAHNPWWGENFDTLAEASSLPPRSDYHNLIDRLDSAYGGESEANIFGVHGQTGVGKTTLLRQIAATTIDRGPLGVPNPHVAYEVEDAFNERQVLYVPFEESLYQLEEEQRALEYADTVFSYFESRVAQSATELLVLLDDVGALGDDPASRYELLETLAGEGTYVIVTSSFESQVTPPPDVETDTVAGSERTLPMKFVDVVKALAESDLASLVERHQSSKVDPEQGEAHLEKAKNALAGTSRATDTGDPEAFVRTLERFYFEVLEGRQRATLQNLARQYLRTGGFPDAVLAAGGDEDGQPAPVAAGTDRLVHSRLLLHLYKELPEEYSITRPRKLHHLCSLAAAGTENAYGFDELTARLDVDRRTIQRYIEALETEIILTESREYSLERHRETRLYLRDPRHVTLLSRRHEHEGFEDLAGDHPFNPEFERQLARSAAFDHAMRMAFGTGLETGIEYAETEEGVIEYVLRGEETIYPFALGYEPRPTDVRASLAAFDPSTGTDRQAGGRNNGYDAAVRFNICDALPRTALNEGTLSETFEHDGDQVNVAHLPLWLFMLCA